MGIFIVTFYKRIGEPAWMNCYDASGCSSVGKYSDFVFIWMSYILHVKSRIYDTTGLYN